MKAYQISLLLSCLLLLCFSNNPYCPAYSNTGGLFVGILFLNLETITAGYGGNLILTNGANTLEYNYTLQNQFTNRPGIAIGIIYLIRLGVSKFEWSPSPDFIFFIKPIKYDLSGYIPIIVRTPWCLTQWYQLTFRVLVEDRVDI